MLCFIFAALVVVLDQLFKHWIVQTLELYGQMDIIPGVIGLTHIQNDGAAFSILSNQRWLLAGIAFIAAIVLVFILLRYTDGFWGTLGLAAVLGGTVGNLIDRVFQGYVVDMFRPLFINFAIFNIADIFLTLGFATFCLHFIASFIRSLKRDEELDDSENGEEAVEAGDPYSMYDVPERRKPVDYDALSDTKVIPVRNNKPSTAAQPEFFDAADAAPEPSVLQYAASDQQDTYKPGPEQQDFFQPEPETPEDILTTLDALSALESDLGSIDDYDTDALLREYGFDN